VLLVHLLLKDEVPILKCIFKSFVHFNRAVCFLTIELSSLCISVLISSPMHGFPVPSLCAASLPVSFADTILPVFPLVSCASGSSLAFCL
jgi:hypothetical protein